MDVRTFISIPIPVNKELSELLNDLRKFPGIRIPNVKQMHITLKFIGNVNENKLNIIKECVEKSVSDINKSSLELKGFGSFPDNKDPKIIWIGIKTDLPLKKISDSIGKELDNVKIDYDDKPFKPHITIGRINEHTDISNILSKYKDKSFYTVNCDSIKIMKSELLNTGAKHTVLFSIGLKN